MSSPEFEAVIGLEVHVQLRTESKIFSAASTAFGGAPNSHVDPYTLGLPGTLPVLNHRAVEYAVRLGLACGADIRLRSEFSRKHYFYPDLPKGYQISQFDQPICENGHLEFMFAPTSGGPAERRKVRLVRIHLEEDAGKNLHVPGGGSLIDYNRAGVPLVEVVSHPDLRSAEEAAEYLRAVRQLVRFLGISDGNMEEGSLRCDANVSIRPRGEQKLGQRTELKNINSFKFVKEAIEHEIGRQIGIVKSGGRIVQETRGWDAQRGTSRSQRSKEEAHDYRYLPDPDLPPLVLDPVWLQSVAASLPATPMQRRDRYVERLGLTGYDAQVLTAERELCDYFDQVLRAAGVPLPGPASASVVAVGDEHKARAKLAANWLAVELLGHLNRESRTLAESPIPPDALGELVQLIGEGTISGKQGKDVFAQMIETRERPAQIVAALGLSQLTDPAAIEAACRKVLDDPLNQKQVDKYRQNPKLLGFFVGKVLAETGGRAQPERVSETLLRLLGSK
ncbi:MAG: Asp-tRNA(Asn)/Glu-tRNA(Gln) amidotransferase subunit GatB [Polyangia bacterium]